MSKIIEKGDRRNKRHKYVCMHLRFDLDFDIFGTFPRFNLYFFLVLSISIAKTTKTWETTSPDHKVLVLKNSGKKLANFTLCSKGS